VATTAEPEEKRRVTAALNVSVLSFALAERGW
jgi:hypothetical protein